MKTLYVTRRDIVKTLLALGAGGVSLSYWSAFAAEDVKIAVPPKEANDATLEVFRALSQIVTLRDDLDAETVQKMYKVFMDERWAPEHIVRLYNKLRGALGDVKRAGLKDSSWQLDDGEKWFASHLLTTWYLGVYYHEERPTQRIAYEQALMFAPLRGIIPVPYVEPIGFGAWAKPPEKAG